MPEITIDQDKCTGCAACVDLCSVTHVYVMENKKAVVFSPSRCWECGQCVGACPVDAISHSSFPLKECPLLEHCDEGLERLTGLFQERRSLRVYKDKPVERERISALVEAARWAPSGGNRRAVTWFAVDDRETIMRLGKNTVEVLLKKAPELRNSITPESSAYERKLALFQAKTYEHLGRRLEKDEHPVFFGAPVVLLAVTPNSHFGRDDAVISGYTMQLAAVQMGLATCQIGYFIVGTEIDPGLGKTILDVPENHMIQMVLTLGYPKYMMRRSAAREPLSLKWIN